MGERRALWTNILQIGRLLTRIINGLLDNHSHSFGIWAILCCRFPNVESCYHKKNKMSDRSCLDSFICIHFSNAVRCESPTLRRCSLLYRGLGAGFRFQESVKDLHDCELCSSLPFAFASDFSAVLSSCCQSLGKAHTRQHHPGKSPSVKQAQEECLEDVNGRGPGFCFRMFLIHLNLFLMDFSDVFRPCGIPFWLQTTGFFPGHANSAFNCCVYALNYRFSEPLCPLHERRLYHHWIETFCERKNAISGIQDSHSS